MNRSKSASLAHTDIEPPRAVAGSDQSHRPTAPGIAYQPIRMRKPLAATPGSSRRRCARNSVTLTTTGAFSGSWGPGIHGVRRGTAEAAVAILVSSIPPSVRLHLFCVTVQCRCLRPDQFEGARLSPGHPARAGSVRTTGAELAA